ncbi:helix-turn-helix domain-containing protein [Micromonospora sp. NPDC005206]|uniref:helix-turn-helix domain-containing protein n=1 Tax=Micromonospora sp. NPDC005206 TaxID=3157022 RepID=UPI0033B19910
MVLLAAEGLSNAEIGRRAGMTRQTVIAWRARYESGGTAAGRLQLAAFTLGHGGTGLTFYDQDISDAFDTRAACMLAVPIGLPTYRPKPGGPPGRPRRLTL